MKGLFVALGISTLSFVLSSSAMAQVACGPITSCPPGTHTIEDHCQINASGKCAGNVICYDSVGASLANIDCGNPVVRKKGKRTFIDESIDPIMSEL